VRDPRPTVSTGCFPPTVPRVAVVHSRPDGRTSPSRPRRWRHSPRAAGRGRRQGCRLLPVGSRTQPVPRRTLTASWGSSFRRGPPKPPSYSSFNLPSISGKTSGGLRSLRPHDQHLWRTPKISRTDMREADLVALLDHTLFVIIDQKRRSTLVHISYRQCRYKET